MTPHQIDVVTNGLIATHDWIAAHGRPLATATATTAAWLTIPRITRRASRRRGLRRLEQYANNRASRTILDDFHQPRKEKPQP